MQDETIVDVNSTPATQDVVSSTNSEPTFAPASPDVSEPTGVTVGFPNGEAALNNISNCLAFVEAAGINVENVDNKIVARQFLGAVFNAIQKGIEEAKNVKSLEETASEVPSETASEVPSETASEVPSEIASEVPSETASENIEQIPTIA